MSLQIVIDNARIFDGWSDLCAEGQSLLVEDGVIREIGDRPVKARDAGRIDAAGKTLMPGLIDLHIHAYGADLNSQKRDLAGEPYRAAYAIKMLGHALDCGFTTVRDIGGGDWSLSKAIEDGLVRAPRFYYAGKILSMTGGHGDFRQTSESLHTHGYCSCGQSNSLCVVADGVDECLKAVREELRRGAHCIKIMASGGVISETDPIWMNQYREDEIRAIVGECTERRTYVAAHCHPAASIRRSVEFGVRTIEHGTLIDAETAEFVAARGAYIVPTMACAHAAIEIGKAIGLPRQSLEKAEYAYSGAFSGLEHMRRAGVKIGFGTDLMGSTHVQQCTEFTLRRDVFSPLEILRQATRLSAEVLMEADRLGCIKVGAQADLLVVDGDPLTDITLLAANGNKLDLIMRAGEIVKNRLT